MRIIISAESAQVVSASLAMVAVSDANTSAKGDRLEHFNDRGSSIFHQNMDQYHSNAGRLGVIIHLLCFYIYNIIAKVWIDTTIIIQYIISRYDQ